MLLWFVLKTVLTNPLVGQNMTCFVVTTLSVQVITLAAKILVELEVPSYVTQVYLLQKEGRWKKAVRVPPFSEN